MSMPGYPALGLQAVTGFLVEQWVGLRIQATLSCYSHRSFHVALFFLVMFVLLMAGFLHVDIKMFTP